MEYVEEEGDAAGAKTCGAGGEGMPTAAMAEARMGVWDWEEQSAGDTSGFDYYSNNATQHSCMA